MFHFRTLGRIELTAEDGRSIHSVLAQPKRVSLLAYLVVASPRGFHRRDSLLGIFWPESDDERARNSLRQSIHFLKRSFEDQLLLSRGDDELGVDAEQLRCDVIEFERLLAAGRPEEALALYEGEFLPGMYVSQAPEFERWVERERSRLATAAATAAWAVVDQRSAAGDLAGALLFARRAMELNPLDEGGLRKLLTLYDRMGERAGAVQAHADFVRRLELELGIEPSAETQALIEGIRSRVEANPAVPAPTFAAPPTPGPVVQPAPAPLAPAAAAAHYAAAEPAGGVAVAPPQVEAEPLPAEEASSGVEPQRLRVRMAPLPDPRWSRARRATVAGALFVGLLVAMIGAWSAARETVSASASAAGGAAVSIAVLPFAVHGSTGSAYLSEGMVDVLSTNLEGASDFAAVDQNRVLRRVTDADGGGHIDPNEGVRFARALGAEYFVTGSVLELGDKVQVAAALYRATRQRSLLRDRIEPTLVAQGVAEGGKDELLRIGDVLATKLLVGYHNGPSGHLAQVAALTARSYAALKAFLKGESAVRRGNMAQARGAFQEAVALDSLFALAHYRLAVTSDWLGQPAAAERAAEAALRHASRLAEHDRWLLQAYLNRRRGEVLEADRYYRAILASHPEELEAWWMRGELLMRFGPLRGHPLVNAKEPFERAVFLDPEHQPSHLALAMIAASQGYQERADSLFSAWPNNDDALTFSLLHAFIAPDSGRSVELEQRLARAGDYVLFRAVSTASVFSADLPNAILAGRLLTAPSRSIYTQRQGHAALASLQLARGNWSGAQIELGRLEQIDSVWANRLRASFALLPFVATTPAEVEAARASLRRESGVSPLADSAGAVLPGLPDPTGGPEVRDLLLGLLSAQTGDTRTAQAMIARLEARAAVPGAPALAGEWARSIRAQLAHAADRPEVALELLDFTRTAPLELAISSPFMSMGYARYLRAEILFQSRRYAEALEVYRALESGSVYDLVYLAPSYLRQGEILEYLNQPEAAVRAYRKVTELLRQPDPRFASLLNGAQRRLRALEHAER